MKSRQKAFSLIELLVVIAIVVILAILVWVLLNPVEQLKKAQDNAKLSNAKELAKGIERYFVAMNEYPWNKRNDAFNAAVRNADRMYYYDPGLPDSDINWIWNLVDAEEIKEAAARKIVNDQVYYIYKPDGKAGGSYSWVCFEPESHQFQQQAADACNIREGKTNPDKDRTFDPCHTTDGTVPDPLDGMRNLLCVAD